MLHIHHSKLPARLVKNSYSAEITFVIEAFRFSHVSAARNRSMCFFVNRIYHLDKCVIWNRYMDGICMQVNRWIITDEVVFLDDCSYNEKPVSSAGSLRSSCHFYHYTAHSQAHAR